MNETAGRGFTVTVTVDVLEQLPPPDPITKTTSIVCDGPLQVLVLIPPQLSLPIIGLTQYDGEGHEHIPKSALNSGPPPQPPTYHVCPFDVLEYEPFVLKASATACAIEAFVHVIPTGSFEPLIIKLVIPELGKPAI